jgi:hypothetical protein
VFSSPDAEGSRRPVEIRDSARAGGRGEDRTRIADRADSGRTGERCGGGSEGTAPATGRSVEAQRAAAAASRDGDAGLGRGDDARLVQDEITVSRSRLLSAIVRDLTEAFPGSPCGDLSIPEFEVRAIVSQAIHRALAGHYTSAVPL